jgi:Lrp/AsnC family transcriptional regulator for asnA, asnC and gidA
MPHRKPQNLEIDNLDIQILSILMKNATTPYTEIAKELIVSGGTIHVRMKKLEEMGVIKGASLEVNPQKLGYDVTAFPGDLPGKRVAV